MNCLIRRCDGPQLESDVARSGPRPPHASYSRKELEAVLDKVSADSRGEMNLALDPRRLFHE